MAANLLSMPQGAAQLPLIRLDNPGISSISLRVRQSQHIPNNSLAPASKPLPEKEKRQVIDVYSGVGGISLGAARAGFEVALAVENDPHALKAHKLNFPNAKHSEKDVSTLDGPALLAAAELEPGALDGLVGGPPCQGFSYAGMRNMDDVRNNLFIKFFDLVAQTRPRFFVAENVLGILMPEYDPLRQAALDLVRPEYVVLAPLKIKASDYGAPTSRERVFFIGYRADAPLVLTKADFEARKVKPHTTVKDALSGLPPIRSTWLTEDQGWRCAASPPDSAYAKNISGNIPDGVGDPESLRRYQQKNLVSGCLGTIHTEALRNRYAALKQGGKDEISRAVRLKPNGLCPTLRAGTASDKGSFQAVRPIHPNSPRVITPREAARLQGFPDWFQFAPSKWHSFRQIGNSVSPFVAEAVLKTIHSKLVGQQP